ncbi:ribonuclease activity regulator RraA [Aureimonas flava]|uniref:Ribonuclease activity regulator RraA n=1 Tax=Aureimonas flava TaxID=2320271 RepID=A0A3A1WLN9_9HYPH|nr:ribonuclease activity regulator RraA [Aureimonas flava]RIY01632.1 ribonuclease activity regulator RraA [Aureimonas flava]
MTYQVQHEVDVPLSVIERLRNVSSGSLTTELFKKGLRQCFLVGLQPMNPNAVRFAGEAFTLRMIPAREDIDTIATLTPFPNPNNLQWEAVENIGKGQVLMIDSRNDPRAASAGAMLPTRMKMRGAAAIVTDGSFRDGQELRELDFPAYGRQVTASTRLSYHHVADLQVPVACAEVAVYPGDIVVGDGDGVTVIPRHLAAEMADLCERRDELEKYLSYRVGAGEALYGVYPPTEATRADFAAWKAAGARPEDAPRIRAEAGAAA